KVWNKFHEEIQNKLEQNKKDLEEQTLRENKALNDWLVQRGQKHAEHIVQIDRYIGAVNAAEVDLFRQYNKAYTEIRRDYCNVRNELYSNYQDAKYKAQKKFATNLVAMAAAAVIAPQLSVSIAGSMGASLGIAAGSTAAASLTLVIEGALMGSL